MADRSDRKAARRSVARWTKSRFLHDVAAYGASELAGKISRLAVVVVLARTVPPADIGTAAAAMAASEVLKSLTENGVGQRIIAAPAGDVAALCATAHRLFRLWCAGLFALQSAVGLAFYLAGGSGLGFVLMVLLGAEYLLMPGGLVQCALAMREGKLRQTALVGGAQNVAANLLTVAFVACFPGPVAIVLPKLVAAPVWLFGMRRLRPWRPLRGEPRAPAAPFVRFGGAVLGVEVLEALRLQADKLIVGAMLGAPALGTYYFAFNAGLSMAGSFATAFSTVAYPHLCRDPDRDRALGRAFLFALGVLTPAVLLQALAAPLYVPVVFGDRWAGAAPLVSVLCLSAVPAVAWSTSAQWLRSKGRADVELLCSAVIAASLLAATAIGARQGLPGIACSVLATAVAVQFGASLPALRAALAAARRPSPSLLNAGA